MLTSPAAALTLLEPFFLRCFASLDAMFRWVLISMCSRGKDCGEAGKVRDIFEKVREQGANTRLPSADHFPGVGIDTFYRSHAHLAHPLFFLLLTG